MPAQLEQHPSPGEIPRDAVADMVATLGTLLDLRTRVAGAMTAALRAESVREVESLEGQRQAIRMELSSVTAELPSVVAALEPESLGLLRLLSSRASSADAEVDDLLRADGHPSVGAWLRSRGILDLEAIAELMADPWRPECDLVLLIGTGATQSTAALTVRGQQRIFCFDPAAPETRVKHEGICPGLANFHSPEALQLAVTRLAGPPPASVRAQSLGATPPARPAELIARVRLALAN